MKEFRKVAVFLAAISFIIAFISCDTATTSKGDDTPVTYSISIAEGIEHGTISTNVASAEAGTSITLTAKPEDGYTLEAYSVKDSAENEIPVVEGSFQMPKSDVTVSATFKADEPAKEDPGTEEPGKEEPGKEEPGKEEPGKEEPEEIKKWTVTFVTNTESNVETQTIENEKKAVVPNAISKVGYTFAGWFNGDKQFDFETAITANLTLTAKWTAVTYKITYAGIDGAKNPNTIATYTIESDDIILSDASKDGFTFAGWKNVKGEAVTKIAKGSTGDVELTATWIEITKQTFTVTFAVDGETSAQKVEENAKATKPTDPAKAGFTFDGWYNGTAKFDFNSEITTDTTLIAKWTAITYKITYAGIDGAVNPNTATTFKVTDEITLSNASKTSYTFGGWKNAKGEAVTKIAKGTTGDITLTATWSADSYKITYAGVDGATNPNTVTTYTIESDDITLSNATKADYTFGGWKNAKGEVLTKIAKGSTGDITLTAVWSADSYKITYAGVDGATNPNTVTTYTVESDEITLSDAAKTGYTFGGWKNAKSEVVTKIAKGSTGDIELTASWTAITYNITYAEVDGATNPNTTATYTIADEITLSDASKAGYTFDGWKNEKNEAVTKIAKGTTGDITLTATWALSTNTAYKVLHYKQNVDNDEYTLADIDNLTGTTAAQTSAETKNYEHFTAGSVTQAEIAADGSTEVKIYYTREIITYTIDLAGGTLGDSTENFTLSGRYGKSIEAVEDPTRQNYKFSGWNTVMGTIPTTLEENTTYTALWTAVNGISVTIGSNSTIGVKQEENKTSIVFTAEKDFTDYKWLIDGVPADSKEGASVSEDGTVLTILKSKFKDGVAYPITLRATKKGMPYGTQISLIWYEVN